MDILDDYERRYRTTADALIRQFDGRAMVPPGEALTVERTTPLRDPARAAVMRERRGTYPYRLTPIGRRKVVLVADIALALVGPAPEPNADVATETQQHMPPAKRGPGSPRKVRLIERVAAEGVAT